AAVRGLAKGWTSQKPQLDEQNLQKLMARLPPERRGTLVRLAKAWGSKRFENMANEAASSLLGRVKDETLKSDERLAAARELVGYQTNDAAVAKVLLELITPGAPPELTTGLL